MSNEYWGGGSPSTGTGVTAKEMLISQWLFLHSVDLRLNEIYGSEFYF